MSIKMESLEEGHILYVTITDPWTVAEMEAMYVKETALRDESKFVMHTLINVSNMRKLPPGLISIARRTPSLTHPRRGHMVVVGATAFAQAITETLVRITRALQTRFFKTEDEAINYLRTVIASEVKKEAAHKSGEFPTAGSSGPV
jgi:hypothetical protein